MHNLRDFLQIIHCVSNIDCIKESPGFRAPFNISISSVREVPSGKRVEGSSVACFKCKYLCKLFMGIY